jgi:hypothetical protein
VRAGTPQPFSCMGIGPRREPVKGGWAALARLAIQSYLQTIWSRTARGSPGLAGATPGECRAGPGSGNALGSPPRSLARRAIRSQRVALARGLARRAVRSRRVTPARGLARRTVRSRRVTPARGSAGRSAAGELRWPGAWPICRRRQAGAAGPCDGRGRTLRAEPPRAGPLRPPEPGVLAGPPGRTARPDRRGLSVRGWSWR